MKFFNAPYCLSKIFPFFLFFISVACHAQVNNGLLIDSRYGSSEKSSTPSNDLSSTFTTEDVNNFSGSSKIQIPIYQIKLKGLTIPIALNYNNTGIKVNQNATWVGLGWSLNAGGVITRSVYGFPDDIWKNNLPLNYQYGFLLDKGEAVNNFVTSGLNDEDIQKQLAMINGTIRKRSDGSWVIGGGTSDNVARRSDTRPDLFNYSFAGRIGKFVFGNDEKVKLINYEPLEFDYVIDNSGNPVWSFPNGTAMTSKGLTSFTVKDENGNKFIFSTLETSQFYTEGFRIRTRCDIDPDAPNFGYSMTYTTAWHLTQIQTLAGENIVFNYVTENVKTRNIERSERSHELINSSNPLDIIRKGYTQHTSYIASKRLSSIETPNEVITFVAGFGRADVTNSSVLSDIQIISKFDDRLVKSVHFSYDYFYRDTNDNEIVDKDATEGNLFQRLKLTSIRTTFPGEKFIDKYDFDYHEESGLPGRGSNQQDFWGYYNRNGATHMFPKIYVNASGVGPDRFSVLPYLNPGTPKYYTLNGAERDCNPNTVKLGTLKRIRYPTGGYSEYYYEPHTFMYKGKQFNGGGLRVNKIVNYDGISHSNDLIKSYRYIQSSDSTKSSGVLFNLPIFAYLENSCAVDDKGSGVDNQGLPSEPRDSYNYFIYNMVRVGNPFTVQGFGDEINVGYSEIKEEVSDNGHIWSRYSTPGRYGDLNDIEGNGCSISENGFCDGLYAVQPISTGVTLSTGIDVADQGPDLVGVDLSANSYPFLPNSNYDWNRGALLEKKMYDQSGVLKKETFYSYVMATPETGLYTLNGLFYINGSNYNIKFLRLVNTSTYYTSALIYYNKYKIYANLNKLPSVVREVEYSPSGSLITSKSYSYSKRKFPSSEIYTNSLGETRKTTFQYPFDLDIHIGSTIGTQNPFSHLVQKNNIATPVETVKTVVVDGTEKVIEAHATTYSSISAPLALPMSEALLQTTAPIPKSDYQQFSIEWDEGRESPSKDMRMNNRMFYNKYDERGNSLEYQVDRIYYSQFWGYNKLYPIANVTNSEYKDIFHENFEEYSLGLLSSVGDARTGRYSKLYGFSKSLTGLTNGNYILSYWKKSGNTWIQITENDINVTSGTYNININGSLQIDDICFYPKNAQMSTSTYIPLVGVGSFTDVSGRTIYYEYDDFNRLKNILNAEHKILKHYEYNNKQ